MTVAGGGVVGGHDGYAPTRAATRLIHGPGIHPGEPVYRSGPAESGRVSQRARRQFPAGPAP